MNAIGTSETGVGQRRLDAALSSSRVPILDGLRALAVALVITTHFVITAHLSAGVPLALVSVFFVLSGFVITWLLLREHESTGSISLSGFFVRRAVRILPAYYAFVVFSIALDRMYGDARIASAAVPALFYYTNYFNALHGHPASSVAHLWSLAVELQFYVVAPLAFLLLAARGRRALLYGAAFAIVAVAAWRSFAFLWLGLGPAYAYNAFDCRFDALAAGCLLAVSCGSPRFRSAMETCAGRWHWAPLLFAVMILPVFEYSRPWYRYTIGFTIQALAIAFVIGQLLVLHAQTPWRFLDSRPMRYLGSLSYGMYLYHLWGLSIGRHLSASSPWLEFPVGFAVTIALAAGSYYLIEQPAVSLKRRFAPGVPPAPSLARAEAREVMST
jgi:peptidoglycan/LPS O-acetylase OafA/YrhL